MSDTKTLADINHDAWHRHGGTEGFPAIPLSSRAPEYQEAWRAAAEEVRKAVIEQCIEKIQHEASFFDDGGQTAAKRLCFVLRSIANEGKTDA